jgi:predicted transposase/invertase (TIGR01784 family)
MDHSVLSDVSEIVFLELPKVPEVYESKKDMWALFLATNNEEVIDMLAKKNNKMAKAVERLKYVSTNEEERFRIAQLEKGRNDYYAGLRKSYDDGLEQGIEQGLEQGIERGHVEERHLIAKSLLNKSLPIELIAETTGLSIDEVKAIDEA